MSARPLCVVTGATGAIGPAVVEAFRADGYEVRTLSRSGDVRADITDAEGVRRGVAGADCVVHLAALLHVNNPPPSMREDYQRINVGGTENVVAAAWKEGVRRVVHVSTIAVHPDWRGHGVGEALFVHLLETALDLGAVTATLEVRVTNERAQGLYRKYLFEVVGRRKRYYRDNGEDALLMTAELPAGYREQMRRLFTATRPGGAAGATE